MRRLLLLTALLAGVSAFPFSARLAAQDAQHQESTSEQTEDDTSKWKLINTGIFALILGFAVIKYAPGFFNARSVDIQKAIKDATGLKIEADFRYSEIDKKMANLAGEVAKLRSLAKAEMEREHERLKRETHEELERMRMNGDAEIDALQKDGVRQVKFHTAQLALGLAERRLQTYFAEGKATDDMGDFVKLVEQGEELMPTALSKHYAQALADAVFAPDSGLKPELAVEQVSAAEQMILGSKELMAALLSPAVSKARKVSVLSRLAEEMGLHRLIRNFLLVLASHRRVAELRSIRQSFEEVVDERLGWIRAEIASARELSGGQREEIETALGKKLGKFIRPTYIVDAALIGGVRARVAAREYDATIRGKLDSMRQRLTAGAS